MADTKQVLEGLAADDSIGKMTSLRLPVLVPNLVGLQTALGHPPIRPLLREVAVFTAASDTFSQRNTNCTVAESLRRLEEVCREATKAGLAIRGYVSTVVGCPYEGVIEPAAVADVARELLRLGCYEVSLGDTIGVGTPGSVRRLLATLLRTIDPSKLAVHLHDTYGQALANIVVALEVCATGIVEPILPFDRCRVGSGRWTLRWRA